MFKLSLVCPLSFVRLCFSQCQDHLSQMNKYGQYFEQLVRDEEKSLEVCPAELAGFLLLVLSTVSPSQLMAGGNTQVLVNHVDPGRLDS